MFLVPTTRLLHSLLSLPYRYTSIPHTENEIRILQPVLTLTLATELNRKGISLMWIITLKMASWDMNTKHGICLMFTCRKGTQAPEGYFGTLMENISGGAEPWWYWCLLPNRGRGGKREGEWAENEKQLEKVAQSRVERKPHAGHISETPSKSEQAK